MSAHFGAGSRPLLGCNKAPAPVRSVRQGPCPLGYPPDGGLVLCTNPLISQPGPRGGGGGRQSKTRLCTYDWPPISGPFDNFIRFLFLMWLCVLGGGGAEGRPGPQMPPSPTPLGWGVLTALAKRQEALKLVSVPK